jgi:hypothetical protein
MIIGASMKQGSITIAIVLSVSTFSRLHANSAVEIAWFKNSEPFMGNAVPGERLTLFDNSPLDREDR